MFLDEIEIDGSESKNNGNEEEFEEDFSVDLPYGIQNVRRDLSYFTRNTRSRSSGNSNRDKVKFFN